jgi:hypothetical protein
MTYRAKNPDAFFLFPPGKPLLLPSVEAQQHMSTWIPWALGKIIRSVDELQKDPRCAPLTPEKHAEVDQEPEDEVSENEELDYFWEMTHRQMKD